MVAVLEIKTCYLQFLNLNSLGFVEIIEGEW